MKFLYVYATNQTAYKGNTTLRNLALDEVNDQFYSLVILFAGFTVVFKTMNYIVYEVIWQPIKTVRKKAVTAYFNICLAGLWKDRIILGHDYLFSRYYSNPAIPEYEAVRLTTQL
jgi:hypothetical protein